MGTNHIEDLIADVSSFVGAMEVFQSIPLLKRGIPEVVKYVGEEKWATYGEAGINKMTGAVWTKAQVT